MRSTALAALLFALFALFSTVVYAAPAAPQGAIMIYDIISPSAPTTEPTVLLRASASQSPSSPNCEVGNFRALLEKMVNGEKGLKGTRRENARSRSLRKGDARETSGE
ncbi:hypothetical protein BJV77DRAFT_966416 [Russula vinacea]|nr:hypothetical protein BJV77DRAFT_966416 [Russula vinacea]